jgi:hypothetical protein
MTDIACELIDPAYEDIARHIAAGRFAESGAALKVALDRDGEQPDLLRLLGRHFEGFDAFDRAYPVYKRLLASREPDADTCGRLARCCLLLGRPHEAASLAKTLAGSLAQPQLSGCIAGSVLTWKGKWDEARAALEFDSASLDASWRNDADCRRQLCENVLALRSYRKDAFAALAGAKPPLHVRKAAGPSGPSGLQWFHDGRWVRLFSPPPQALQVPDDKRNLLQAISLAFSSLTAWPLIKHCYQERSPILVLTQQQALHLFESDLQVFYGLAMLEDLRPYIAATRVHWYLGPGCAESFRRSLEADQRTPVPPVTIGHHPVVAQAIEALSASRDEERDRLIAELQVYYRGLPADHGRRVFSQTLGRPSRVYLVTTRFSTVLQFVTRDTERAFRRLGWETRLAIESDDLKVHTDCALVRDLAEFRPDVVFMLDHLRYECVFSSLPELYHLCWIQDQMPNLYCTRAGESIGARDFVLVTGCGADITHRYRYPRRCLVHMPFSTNLETRATLTAADLTAYSIPDVAFASNHGRTPEGVLPLVLNSVGGGCPPETHAILGPYLQAVLHAYETGDIPYEDVQYQKLLEATEARTQIRLPDPHARVILAREFRLHVGGAVHRQQVLHWLKDDGVRLGIYGREWERHPEFAPYARGVVTDANVMNAIFRATPVNLQISQYSNSHIRFWNGLAAGGFFLVRMCPADSGRVATENVLALLCKNRGRSYTDVLKAGGISPWEEVVLRSHFEQSICGHNQIDDYAIDIFRMTLETPTWADRMGDLVRAIQFETREQCLEMTHRYLTSPSARAEVMDRIGAVLESQTYEANLRRALATIAERIG